MASKEVAIAAPLPDAEMGAQLTEQYQRAVNAMPEILRFGCMMIRLRQLLFHDGKATGNNVKDTGMKAWIERYAPKIKLPSAYRFEQVTLGIAEEYQQLVGAKIAKQYAIQDLVSADPESLPAPVRKKQQSLFEYVAGTSQKSWLDKLKPIARKGGNTYDRTNGKGDRNQLTPEQATELLQSLCKQAAQHLASVHSEQAYITLTDAELDGLADHCATVLDDVKAWRRMSKGQRSDALAAQIARTIKG